VEQGTPIKKRKGTEKLPVKKNNIHRRGKKKIEKVPWNDKGLMMTAGGLTSLRGEKKGDLIQRGQTKRSKKVRNQEGEKSENWSVTNSLTGNGNKKTEGVTRFCG